MRMRYFCAFHCPLLWEAFKQQLQHTWHSRCIATGSQRFPLLRVLHAVLFLLEHGLHGLLRVAQQRVPGQLASDPLQDAVGERFEVASWCWIGPSVRVASTKFQSAIMSPLRVLLVRRRYTVARKAEREPEIHEEDLQRTEHKLSDWKLSVSFKVLYMWKHMHRIFLSLSLGFSLAKKWNSVLDYFWL